MEQGRKKILSTEERGEKQRRTSERERKRGGEGRGGREMKSSCCWLWLSNIDFR